MMAGAAWSLTTPGDSRGGASPVTQTGRPSDDSGQSATSSEIAQAPATQRKSSRTKAKAAAGAETKELSRDDGKMAGRKSIAGGGHLVKFESPGEGWKLTSVKLHGSRYGYPQPPDEDIVIYLCDESFKPVAEYKFPYAKFERGDAKWVTLPTQPTELPPVFWIGVNFNPEATKGVYMSHDAAGSGTSSVGVPGGRRPPRPFEQGDWLIRAVVEPAEAGKSPTPK
jgi:RNA polymerase sigma-70 factor (ECF subfamily)